MPSAKASKQSYEGQEATEPEAAQADENTSEEEAAPAASTEESSKSSQEQETGGQEGDGIPVMEDYLTESESSLRQPLQCHCFWQLQTEPIYGALQKFCSSQWRSSVDHTGARD